MKISYYIYSIVFILLSLNLTAQSPQLLKAEGEIPKDFITPSAKKYKKQVQALSDKKSKKNDKKNKKQFLLESNFRIDDILQSGMVLFNDPASVYVNKVLGNLPFENKKLIRKNPRVYILNSSAVNAFATDQGIIFVTLGLLANLENESQLAFILAHELMHISHQHSIDKFVKSKNIDKENSRNKNMTEVAVDRNMFKKSMYSRQLEEEADEDGLELFLKSNYDPKVILNTFKILHYAYLPFDEIAFEKSFFEDEHFILPSILWLDSLNKISPMKEDAEEEKNSSHPASSKRMQNLKAKIVDVDDKTKKAFLLPENEFFEIQKKARYQIPFLNLYAENFPEAIYTSHLMLKEYPNDIELKKVIGKALYMEAKYRNVERENETFVVTVNRDGSVDDYNYSDDDEIKIEGASHQVYNLLETIDKKDLLVLALKYNWKIYQSTKDDVEMKLVMEDMFAEFASFFKDVDDFAKTSKSKIAPKVKEVKKEEEKTKLEKIADETETQKDKYWQYAFVNELKVEEFKTHYQEGLDDLAKRKKREDYYESSEGRRELSKDRKKEKKKGKSLGIKKVVVVNPFYLSVDARRNKGIQYIRTEEKQVYFSEAIKKYAAKSKIKTELLDVTQLAKKDVEKFNEVYEINHYFSQQMNHDDLSLTPSYNQNRVNEIAEKYGTDYFLWTGVISLREKNNLKPLLVGVLAPYILPLLIPNAVKPKYDMLYYAILFDVKTGRRSVIKMDYFDKRDSKAILNTHIYDVFHQINKE